MNASQLAVQMYTVRDFTKTAEGLADSLSKIAAIGYRAVQLSGIEAMSGDAPAVDAALARTMLDDNGLRCIATHRSWDSLAHNTQAEIDFHHALGCDFTAIGSLPGAWDGVGADAYAQFVQDSAPVIQTLKAVGIGFGYHNHAFEFARVEGTRRTLFDTFIEGGGPDLLLEIDVYWAAHAGLNPQRLMERCAGRVPVIHVKDKEMAGNEAVMAPVGEGNLDWTNLIPACDRAGVEWYAVEQDTCRRDPFDCLRSSFEFLSAL